MSGLRAPIPLDRDLDEALQHAAVEDQVSVETLLSLIVNQYLDSRRRLRHAARFDLHQV